MLFFFFMLGKSESHSVVSTLCDPVDYTVHGILQARILKWVAFPFSFPFPSFFVCSVLSDSLRPPWTVAHQALLSMGFFRQEYGSGLPFPPPGDLPDPGTEPRSPALQADSFTTEPLENPKLGECHI